MLIVLYKVLMCNFQRKLCYTIYDNWNTIPTWNNYIHVHLLKGKYCIQVLAYIFILLMRGCGVGKVLVQLICIYKLRLCVCWFIVVKSTFAETVFVWLLWTIVWAKFGIAEIVYIPRLDVSNLSNDKVVQRDNRA